MAGIAFDLMYDFVAAVWGPPEALIRDIWRRFGGRGRALRALAFALTVLVVVVSFAALVVVVALLVWAVDAVL